MAEKKRTRKIRYVRLPEHRIREIENLVDSWSYETKAFIRARLHQYVPPFQFIHSVFDRCFGFLIPEKEKHFTILSNPSILTDWQMRFSVSGQTNPLDAWNKILEKEVSKNDYHYLLYLLDRELADVHVPVELEILFEKLYRAFIRKEFVTDPSLPKSPIVLFIGPTGSGKTVTCGQTIEDIIFGNKVVPEIDFKRKKEEILANQPFWKTINDIDPNFASEMARQKKLHFYKLLSKLPLMNSLLKNSISRGLLELEEQGLDVDYAIVTPNDYQTAFSGEPGNYFRKAMGDPKITSIRHIEEAHSAFGKTDDRLSGTERQQRTLIDSSNIILDEIISGKRDCLLIATTDKPEVIDSAIYRRFMEKGKIIDISEFWKNPVNLKAVIRLELLRNDIRVESSSGNASRFHTLSPDDMEHIVEKILTIFRERSLKITPAYVRKLIGSIIEMKGGFIPSYLDESLLVRKAFELVAKNSYGDLFKKVVGKMDRKIKWEEYIGKIKDLFSEMANNSLYYGASEEKGVVLNGPPGSGKTYLSRAWLSENPDVHDITISHTDLQDPANPLDGTVYNLEKVYEIAKMIAPTMVFIDEGDSMTPRRSASGGSPSDRLTNKFLSIIDGEIPLNRVFTVLTTNRLDILDPALIRSKRLKVMEISGHLRKEDIIAIVERSLNNIPLESGLDVNTITETAASISNTPADYTAFVEKVLSLRKTEYEVLKKFRELSDNSPSKIHHFIKLNLKTLLGILSAAGVSQTLQAEINENPNMFIHHYQKVKPILDKIENLDQYPVRSSHLRSARYEISENPIKKGNVQLNEFLEAELSKEPQVGFIIGVGANDVSGMLLPIATSLIYRVSSDKVIITGAVSSSSSAVAELDMAVQMTRQSANEAFTLVENYFQSLQPKMNITKIIGEFFGEYTLHHQLLSASYTIGGPSAGYALAINTLSVLLNIPVYHDFGITGAPWTKGIRRGEVGGSVIISGHKRKTEKILLHLNRMYLPEKNYSDLEPDYLYNYWIQNKDIIGVKHFGDLVPEVLWFGNDHDQLLSNFISLRIDHKRKTYRGEKSDGEIEKKIADIKAILKTTAETEIVRRLSAIKEYLTTPENDPYVSFEEIFQNKKSGSAAITRPT